MRASLLPLLLALAGCVTGQLERPDFVCDPELDQQHDGDTPSADRRHGARTSEAGTAGVQLGSLETIGPCEQA